MSIASQISSNYQAVDLRNIAGVPQWSLLDDELREAVEVVGQVLPFRTNRYVLDQLIDWSQVPDDPIFQLVFPQRAMLGPHDFRRLKRLLRLNTPKPSWLRRSVVSVWRSTRTPAVS